MSESERKEMLKRIAQRKEAEAIANRDKKPAKPSKTLQNAVELLGFAEGVKYFLEG